MKLKVFTYFFNTQYALKYALTFCGLFLDKLEFSLSGTTVHLSGNEKSCAFLSMYPYMLLRFPYPLFSRFPQVPERGLRKFVKYYSKKYGKTITFDK